MANLNLITPALVAEVVAIDDVNDALFRFQTEVGIDDGGVAGIAFSGGWDTEWPSATIEQRHSMMARYIEAERAFAQ
jgi:hypothetical protein